MAGQNGIVFYVSKKNVGHILRYTYMLEGSGIQSRWLWYDIGTTYCNFLQQYEKAINAFEKNYGYQS